METSLDVFSDVRKSYAFWNAWNPSFAFPIEELSDNMAERLALMQLSFQSTGLGQCEELWSSAMRAAFSYLDGKKHKVIFLGENARKPKNRIRSYKGLINKVFNGISIQLEHPTSNGDTILGALVDAGSLQESDFEALCLGGHCSFIASSNCESFFQKKYLELILSKCVCFRGSKAYLDYVRLVSNFVKEHSTIARFGGDGGDQEVSLQVFFDRSDMDAIESDLCAIKQRE